jgi:hypothetical protein
VLFPRGLEQKVSALSEDVVEDGVADIVVSCDGTWQKRGFSSLFGAVFTIAHKTGKSHRLCYEIQALLRLSVLGKKYHCSNAYSTWKEAHKCDFNHSGSASSMEPHGALEMFHSSLQYKGSLQESDRRWRLQNVLPPPEKSNLMAVIIPRESGQYGRGYGPMVI